MLEHGVWETLSKQLRDSAPYLALRQQLGAAVGLPLPAAAWTIALLTQDFGRPTLVIVPHEIDTAAWLEATQLFADQVSAVYFPAPPLSPYQETDVSLLVRAEESVALDAIKSDQARIVITTPRALFRRLPALDAFSRGVLDIAPDEEHPIDALAAHLVAWGYHRSDLVFEVGQFAARGGVFDFFPPGQPMPVRLDLFGDTVESIRLFEPESQRSLETLDSVRVLPLSLFEQGDRTAQKVAELLELHGGESLGEEAAERLVALREQGSFDGWEHYLPLLAEETFAIDELLDDGLIVAFDQVNLLKEANHHHELLRAEFTSRLNQRRLAVAPELLEHPVDRVRSLIEEAAVHLGDLPLANRVTLDFSGRATEAMHDQLPRFKREVETQRARGHRCLLVASENHRKGLTELLTSCEIPLWRRGVELVDGELQRGFQLPVIGLTVFSERQLLRRGPLSRPAKRKPRFGPFLSSLRDLKIGDYVVHVDHGIGQFIAMRNVGESAAPNQALPPVLDGFANTAETTEVMEIVYAGGKNLLLPLSRLDQVQKYSGIEGVAPRLDKLGGTSWNRTKKRIKRGLRDMAAELLKLYAARQMAEAPTMGEDSDLQRQFEAAFVHEETADQLEAIAEIKGDLEGKRPMDRLLCGDVGFGKTEVAMRAAFKVVDNGYQVAVLAPTTILADQHLSTFKERFEGFPVMIDMLSRFRSPTEARDIQKRTEEGKLDILIGTHRLLSRKITFPKLGLLIIDEEQRFGVAHKERLKQLREDVHVLAMSATPVPRTLQLSLAGVRDLSLIETPPRDRMAVETAILPFDPTFIREAVELELERKGQIYYVYNRVETIDRMATYLEEIVPELKITVGHGQLDETELARRMHAFIAGEYDLLLATTIIENGIDIPNVNTMIVHRADRFGLSQLYQLRGRVGRSDQLAYCYLLVEADRVLSQEARKRLDAIREFTELGAGFRVAGRDLEIRGAGNLLGAEQSGHIAAVGIETYLKTLEETVAELRGEKPVERPSVTLDMPVPMSVPADYIGDPNLRMELYQRIATTEESQEDLLRELRDRFGPPPDGVKSLLRTARLKRLAESLYLQGISARGGRLVLRLRQDARVVPEALIDFVSRRPGASFSPSGALTLENVPANRAVDTALEALEQLAAVEPS